MMTRSRCLAALLALSACDPAAPATCQTAFTDVWQVSTNAAVKSVDLPTTWCTDGFNVSVNDAPGGVVRIEHSYYLEQAGKVMLSADAKPGCAGTKITLQVNDSTAENGSTLTPVPAGAGHVIVQVADDAACKSTLSVRFSAWPAS